ncbi:unnamed protein product [Symbiodinium natans]|uniref:Uncharacterized protein n=1 Tax=Symbiodinium natans TaxID=878477 RepID=A0A812IH02_9DINO|nr:unnamed protein product [Symbiodinium natans]
MTERQSGNRPGCPSIYARVGCRVQDIQWPAGLHWKEPEWKSNFKERIVTLTYGEKLRLMVQIQLRRQDRRNAREDCAVALRTGLWEGSRAYTIPRTVQSTGTEALKGW